MIKLNKIIKQKIYVRYTRDRFPGLDFNFKVLRAGNLKALYIHSRQKVELK